MYLGIESRKIGDLYYHYPRCDERNIEQKSLIPSDQIAVLKGEYAYTTPSRCELDDPLHFLQDKGSLRCAQHVINSYFNGMHLLTSEEYLNKLQELRGLEASVEWETVMQMRARNNAQKESEAQRRYQEIVAASQDEKADTRELVAIFNKIRVNVPESVRPKPLRFTQIRRVALLNEFTLKFHKKSQVIVQLAENLNRVKKFIIRRPGHFVYVAKSASGWNVVDSLRSDMLSFKSEHASISSTGGYNALRDSLKGVRPQDWIDVVYETKQGSLRDDATAALA